MRFKVKKSDQGMISQGAVIGAAAAIVLAAIGATGTDLWLASTQWLLVAAVLLGFAIYFRN